MATDRTPGITIDRLGERALLVRVDDQTRVHALAGALLADVEGGRLADVVPGDRTLLIEFDGTDRGEAGARRALLAAGAWIDQADSAVSRPRPRQRVIPVRYGGSDGPDLEETAALGGRSPQGLIDLHVGRDYTVRFLGFAPGFAYIGDLPWEITVPRLATPRTTTRAGSVAIAEAYTGIYPAALPGGWRVIGWTPVLLFDPSVDPPTYLLPGDSVRFESVEAGALPAEPYRPSDWVD